jgi:hypothetical protein
MNNYFLICMLFIAGPVQAHIYKSVDADGHVTYSNVPIKGAQKLDIETPEQSDNGNLGNINNADKARSATGAARAKSTATPEKFPRVDPGTQGQRDGKRKKILLEELEAEKKALVEAKVVYQEGESTPEVYRAADGKIFRNVAKFEEKMQSLRNDVDAHEKNIQLLQKELSSLK